MKHLSPKIFNKMFKENHPNLDVEIVRSPSGYYYFDGKDGFDEIPSLMVYNLNSLGYNQIETHILENIKGE